MDCSKEQQNGTIDPVMEMENSAKSINSDDWKELDSFEVDIGQFSTDPGSWVSGGFEG